MDRVIVAECGVNWNGDITLAKAMIYLARDCAASLAKFQLYDCDRLARTLDQFKALKPCELSYEQAESLFRVGQDLGIEVFFSVFDPLRVEWCERIGVKRYKLAATMADWDTLDAVRVTGKAVIVSTADGDMRYLPSSWRRLYCVPEYPAPLSHVKMPNFRDDIVGFSDHTVGLEASMIALARGAQIIEKHFAISHNPKWPEEAFSMSPSELRELVRWAKVCSDLEK